MKQAKRCYDLLSHLSTGNIYQWKGLKQYSHSSTGRDVKRLLTQGLLKKVGPGMYLFPQRGCFGHVPPDDSALVSAFLKSDDFLLFSTSLYNSLGLGLTQLKNEIIVYNKKRYGTVVLSGRQFYFKRPNNGYPSKLTPEFLLVDLVNNIKCVGEFPEALKLKVVRRVKLGEFDTSLLLELANQHGKVATKKFFNEMRFNKAA